jgi:hypothetical protein
MSPKVKIYYLFLMISCFKPANRHVRDSACKLLLQVFKVLLILALIVANDHPRFWFPLLLNLRALDVVFNPVQPMII